MWQSVHSGPQFAGSIGLLLQVSMFFLWPLVYSPGPLRVCVKNKMEYYSALKRKGALTWCTTCVTRGDVQTVLFLSLRVVHMGVLALENFIELDANVL